MHALVITNIDKKFVKARWQVCDRDTEPPLCLQGDVLRSFTPLNAMSVPEVRHHNLSFSPEAPHKAVGEDQTRSEITLARTRMIVKRGLNRFTLFPLLNFAVSTPLCCTHLHTPL